MRVPIPIDVAAAEAHHPSRKLDGSGIGINYADAWIRSLKVTLPDGRKVACRRRGLKLTLTIGERTGEGLMRRLRHGRDERTVLREALREAAAAAGASFEFEEGVIHLDPDAG